MLSHMGRSGDTQADWYGVAEALARRGYMVLTYNRRGVCPGGTDGCSGGTDDLPASWKDVVGAFEFVGTVGARTTILVGASIGGMSTLYAAASGRIGAAGVIEIGGINNASGYDLSRSEIRRLEGPKLFASSKNDIYGGAESARRWYRWARPPKRLAILPGYQHGTDMLADGEPTARPLRELIVDFVRTVTRSPR